MQLITTSIIDITLITNINTIKIMTVMNMLPSNTINNHHYHLCTITTSTINIITLTFTMVSIRTQHYVNAPLTSIPSPQHGHHHDITIITNIHNYHYNTINNITISFTLVNTKSMIWYYHEHHLTIIHHQYPLHKQHYPHHNMTTISW